MSSFRRLNLIYNKTVATGIAGALGYSGKVDYEAAAAIAATGMIQLDLGQLRVHDYRKECFERLLEYP